jgi:hypothetical protein
LLRATLSPDVQERRYALVSFWREPPRRDDDLLRDAARQLLDLHR